MSSAPLTDAPLKPSFGEKLKAWWEGYDVNAITQRRAAAKSQDNQPSAANGNEAEGDDNREYSEPLARDGKPLWSATRLDVAQFMWGEGFIGPGSADYIPDMVRPVAPTSAMSILELGAGLGGLGRTIAAQYGAWVTCLEASPLLAQRGMELSIQESLEEKAPVKLFDPLSLDIGRRYDCVLAKEAFAFVEDKTAFLENIVDSIKSEGQLLFIDYVLADTGSIAMLQDWCAGEPLQPHMIAVDDMVDMLTGFNLDVRINEDITDIQDRQINSALSALAKHLSSHSMDEDTRAAVVQEVDLWARRAVAFKNGLRCYRFHALKP